MALIGVRVSLLKVVVTEATFFCGDLYSVTVGGNGCASVAVGCGVADIVLSDGCGNIAFDGDFCVAIAVNDGCGKIVAGCVATRIASIADNEGCV